MNMRGIRPHGGFPVSRDWAKDNIKCRRIDCISNCAGYCFVPSRVVIADNGQCKGYIQRKNENDTSSEDILCRENYKKDAFD